MGGYLQVQIAFETLQAYSQGVFMLATVLVLMLMREGKKRKVAMVRWEGGSMVAR